MYPGLPSDGRTVTGVVMLGPAGTTSSADDNVLLNRFENQRWGKHCEARQWGLWG